MAKDPDEAWRPVERDNLSLKVIRQIEENIVEGRYQPGDRLPSERGLAELLGVSRPVIRDAIRTLTTLNLLEVRQGEGTFVTEPDPAAYLRRGSRYLALQLGDDAEALIQLVESRLILETGVVALAVERMNDGRREAIEETLEEQRRALDDDDLDRFVHWDFAFHMALAETTQNRALVHVLSALAELLSASLHQTTRLPGATDGAFAEHRRIFDAILAGDAAGAQAAMRTHLQTTRRAVERVIGRPAKSGQAPEGEG